MNPERTLQPGPWLKSPGWRAGAFIIGWTAIIWFLDWLTGDLIDAGWWRPALFVLLGIAFSWPYGWAWVKGRAPEPPKPAVLVPQAAVHGGESGNTYVLVGPTASTRPGLGQRARDLGPLQWFFYTLLWRWPVMLGDAFLTLFWRGMTRLVGFNGGPSTQSFDPREMKDVDYPEDLPPPDQERF